MSAALRPMPLSVTAKMQPDAIARRLLAADVEPDAAALGELHRVVDEVFERGAQPHRVADHDLRKVRRDRRPRMRYPCAGRAHRATPRAIARRRAAGSGRGAAPGRGRRRATASTISEVSIVRCSPVLLIAIAHSRSRGGEPRGRQQFAERQDAGQRRPDLVRELGERGLDGAPGQLRRALAARLRAARPSGRLACFSSCLGHCP